MLEYAINFNYIVTEKCVEKDNPENMCMGKCYLGKKIEQTKEAEKKQKQFVNIDFVKIPHEAQINHKVKNLIPQKNKYLIEDNYYSSFSVSPTLPPPKAYS